SALALWILCAAMSPPPLPLSPPPAVGPLELSALPPPWLLPALAPPWAAFLATVWVLLLLASPSICSSLVISFTCISKDFVCCPTPGHLSTSKASS
ncbi:hypothetical protein M9458_015637, partial [Cirrhinus mrigala]